MPLTVQQAESEARWRWGGLLTRGVAQHSGQGRLPFEVGTKRLGGAVTIRGRGTSWESAFLNAANQRNGSK